MFELARDGKCSNVLQEKQDTNNSSINSTSTVQQPPGPTISASYASGILRILKDILPSSNSGIVTRDATQHTDAEDKRYRLILHTHTPAHSVKHNQKSGRRWAVETARGIVHTDTVVYATNAYTSHLLPHLAGPTGIIPVRGQVVGARARVGYIDEGWKEKDGVIGLTRSGWGGNQGFEYWFPRPYPRHSSGTSIQNEAGISPANVATDERIQRPLVILGGGRETLKDKEYGMYETDDSKLDAEVSAGLRGFLHNVFPGQYSAGTLESVSDNIEVEWVMSLGPNFSQ
jgi:hypothetical protein